MRGRRPVPALWARRAGRETGDERARRREPRGPLRRRRRAARGTQRRFGRPARCAGRGHRRLPKNCERRLYGRRGRDPLRPPRAPLRQHAAAQRGPGADLRRREPRRRAGAGARPRRALRDEARPARDARPPLLAPLDERWSPRGNEHIGRIFTPSPRETRRTHRPTWTSSTRRRRAIFTTRDLRPPAVHKSNCRGASRLHAIDATCPQVAGRVPGRHRRQPARRRDAHKVGGRLPGAPAGPGAGPGGVPARRGVRLREGRGADLRGGVRAPRRELPGERAGRGRGKGDDGERRDRRRRAAGARAVEVVLARARRRVQR